MTKIIKPEGQKWPLSKSEQKQIKGRAVQNVQETILDIHIVYSCSEFTFCLTFVKFLFFLLDVKLKIHKSEFSGRFWNAFSS